MSFHGGVLGVMLAMYVYARKTKRPFLGVLDYVGPFIPAGLFTGRVGTVSYTHLTLPTICSV